jgi:hypothetical protein
MTEYSRYLLSQLVAIGGDSKQIAALLAAIETGGARSTDVDGQRMLACLAIDLYTGGISAQQIMDAANVCFACGCLERSRFAEAITGDALHAFESCIVGAPIDDGSEYVSLMSIHKFIFFFRANDASVVGAVGIAKEIDYLSVVPGPVPERGPMRAMRGRNRPITWITRLGDIQMLGTGVPQRDARLAALVERLGLPWDAGAYHVVALNYPAGFESFATVGQPNSMCETWELPGLFVSALPENGWGRTCGRRDPSHSGLPERVHGELPVTIPGYDFTVEYLGRVTLEAADERVALQAAEMRWAAVK